MQPGPTAGTSANTISNPFPNGIIGPPGRNPNYAQALLGNGINENQLRNPYGYAQQWNADVQQQLGNGFLIDIAYGGAKGTHLPIDSPQIDQLPDQYLALGNTLLNNVPNPYYGIINAPGSSLAAPTVQQSQLLRPFPQYNGVSYAGQGIGNSTYESLQSEGGKTLLGRQLDTSGLHARQIDQRHRYDYRLARIGRYRWDPGLDESEG